MGGLSREFQVLLEMLGDTCPQWVGSSQRSVEARISK